MNKELCGWCGEIPVMNLHTQDSFTCRECFKEQLERIGWKHSDVQHQLERYDRQLKRLTKQHVSLDSKSY